MNGNRWATVVGFTGALVVLAVLVWIVGIGDIIDALQRIQPLMLVVIGLNAVAWLLLWGMALRTVLGALGQPISVRMAALVFAGAVFSNKVTPFGQAGGEPVTAYLISRATDSEYETGLAAIASVDALHFVPSIGYAIAGLTFVAVGAVTLGRNLLFATAAVALLVLALPVAAYLGWRYRYELEAVVVRMVTPILRWIGHVLPRREPPSAAAIEQRIETFFKSIDRVAGSRTTLLEALGFSALGWLALCGSLWLSLYALGFTVSFGAILLVVPVGAMAGIAPLPGGLGLVDGVLAALVVTTTGVASGIALAAVLIHRGATFVLPTVIGGGVAFALGARER